MVRPQFGLRRFVPDWQLLGLVGLASFYLLPALQTGYWSEDCSHSVGTVGRLILKTEDSLLAVMIHNIRGSIELGRFFPLTPALIDLVFYLIRDVVAYKAYLVGVTVLDVAVFYSLVRRLSGNRNFACLAGCLTILLFQFRVSVDPLLAYYGQIQLVTACLLLSLLTLEIYLESRSRGWLGVSAAAYLVCALMYEATYTLFLLHVLLIVRARRGWSERLKPAMPFLGVVGACALTTFVIQRLYPSDLYVHHKSLAPGPFLTALARQVSTALPLSYFMADRHQVFTHVRTIRSMGGWVAEPRAIVVALAALVLCHACLRRRPMAGNLPVGVGRLLVVMAIMLIVLPVPLIAISPAHRQQFSYGVGWIVVVIECLGMGLLIATMIWQCLAGKPDGRLAVMKSAVVSSVVAVLMGVTYRANLEVATCFSAPPGSAHFNSNAAVHAASYQQQRLNLESALDGGLMDEVPTGSTLRLANVYPLWHDSNHGVFFYAKHTGKFFFIDGRSGESPSTARTYRIRDVSFGPRSGFVVLSELKSGSSGAGHAIGLYVRRPGLHSTGASPGFVVAGESSSTPGHATAAQIDETSLKLSLVRAGRDWGLFSLHTTNDRITADSIRPIFDTGLARRQARTTAGGPPRVGETGRVRR